MDESNMSSPCKECDDGVEGLQLHAEVEHLRQHLGERDAHIVALEGEFIKCTARANDLEEQVSTWREKHERLYDSHKRVQKLNQVLEDKLLQMVDKMKAEKSQLTKDIATLSVRLAESKHNFSMLQKENERYKNDMNLAIQLLQCKPDNFVSQKLDNLPADTQTRVSQYVMSKTSKPSSSAQSKNGNEIDTFDAMSSTGPISIASTSKERSCRILPVDISKNSTPITLKGSKTNAPKSFLKNKKENQTSHSSVRWPCGCLKTSDKLKVLLQQFPSPPPPSPDLQSKSENTSCISAFCTNDHEPFKQTHVEGWELKEKYGGDVFDATKKSWSSAQSWRLVSVIGQIIQIFVTATALAFYYIIYCYMQLIYFTLRSALFFHNADGPMKITIAVVTATSLLLGFNLLLRMERMIGIKFLIK